MIFSQNSLFCEILAKTLEKRHQLEIIAAPVSYASQLIQKNSPKAILIDETLPPANLGEILQTAMHIPDCKVVFVNPYQNETITLTPQKRSMRKADDLMYILNDEISPCVDSTSQYKSINPETLTQARAEMFGLLAVFLNQRPDCEFIQRLRAAGIHQFLDTLVEQDEGSKIHAGLQELGAYLEDTLTADDSSLAEELAVDWTRLFRGLRPGYGPKPPYGFLHQKTRLSELEYLRKIASYYSRFGAEIEPTQSNRPDFLGLQLAFLSFLYQQSSQAYQQGCEQEAEQLENAAADFFSQELADWAIVFCSEAQAHAKTGFYHGFLEILQGQIQEMAAG